MLLVTLLLALLFMMMVWMIPPPVEDNRYGTGVGHFGEMFLQCWTCHLGLQGMIKGSLE